MAPEIVKPQRLVAGARASYMKQGPKEEDPFKMGYAVATRLKDVLPDRIVLITDRFSEARLSDALDLHENLRLIPVSTIAFDAQGQSRRFLKDLARITNGTSKSVKSKMFT